MTKNSTKRNLVVLLIITYATMMLFGFMENMKSVTFPLIKDQFGVNYEAQGGLVSFSWFGYVFFCIVATLSIEKFGTKKSLLFGYVSVVLGCIAVMLAPSFIIVAMALMLLWMGFGFFEVGTNALATTAFTAKSAIFMNLMHFFYGLGAVFGPKTAAILSNSFELSFRGIYFVAIIPLIFVAIVILFSKVKTVTEEHEDKSPLTIKGALKNPYVWLISASLGFMEVIEFGAANWGAFYLRDALDIDPLTLGATFVSVFYICFTVSRLFSGFVIEKIGYAKSIVIALAILFLLYLAGFSLGKSGIWILALTGFFVAILWPTIMCFAMTLFKKDAAIATSVIIVLSGTVNGLMQFATGLINENIGKVWGYRLSTLYVLIPLVLMIYIVKR